MIIKQNNRDIILRHYAYCCDIVLFFRTFPYIIPPSPSFCKTLPILYYSIDVVIVLFRPWSFSTTFCTRWIKQQNQLGKSWKSSNRVLNDELIKLKHDTKIPSWKYLTDRLVPGGPMEDVPVFFGVCVCGNHNFVFNSVKLIWIAPIANQMDHANALHLNENSLFVFFFK